MVIAQHSLVDDGRGQEPNGEDCPFRKYRE